jgi:hypothetical protein
VNRIRAWLIDGLLVIGAIVIALVLSEAGLRLFYPQPMGVWHQDRDGLALHWPGLVTYLPQFGLSVSFNSGGMRDREHAVAKPAGVFRVLVLGDSFIEALQVPFEGSVPSLLERELARQTGRSVEVISASVSGWGTDDELKYLESYGTKWKADLILVAMTLHNDVHDNLRERFHTMEDGALVEKPPRRLSFSQYKLIELKGLLASRSQAYQLLTRTRRLPGVRAEARQLNSHVLNLFSRVTNEPVSTGIELTRLLLERIRSVGTQHGARVTLVLLPLAVQVSGERFAEFLRAQGRSIPDSDVERPQRLLAHVGEQVGIDVIDLLPGFREWTRGGGGSLFLERDGHWNGAGHRLAAKIVTWDLVDRGMVRSVTATSAGEGRRVLAGEERESGIASRATNRIDSVGSSFVSAPCCD